MANLKNKTIIITGASRGIGRAIALKCAADGANIVIAAKSVEENGKLPGTIYSVAEEIKAAGGKALPLQVDVRYEDQIEHMAQEAVNTFGGIDILVNNAGAIKLTGTDSTTPKFYDLMMSVNVRSTFLCTRACLPYLEKSSHAHVLNLSPPISFEERWLKNNIAYTISKYGMSLCTLGMAAEFKDRKIAVNSLWPKTGIATAAIGWLMGEEAFKNCRKPTIMADAAYALLCLSPTQMSGKTLLDEPWLREHGVKDFSSYACAPGEELFPDFFVD